MRIALASDAWTPQVNGVVTTLKATAATLHRPRTRSARHPAAGPVPSVPELSGNPPGGVAGRARGAGTEALSAARDPPRHRGPLGARGTPLLPGTRRALHEFLSHALPGVPAGPLADTAQRDLRLAAPLPRRGRPHLRQQPEPARAAHGARLHRTAPVAPRRGSDALSPGGTSTRSWPGLPRPILTCVGRLAVEKNLEAFLRLPLPGTKVMIGDGPLRGMLARTLPAGTLSRLPHRGGARAPARHGGRARLSEPHRYLRPGDDRGARLRGAGGGLPGARTCST